MKTKTLIAILIFVSISLFSIKAAQNTQTQLTSNQAITLIDKDMAPWVDMGQTNSLAGLLWIQSVAYFGGSLIEAGNGKYLGRILESITTLDPKFISAYQWTALFDQVPLDIAIPILDKGIQEFPYDWQLHLMYADKLIDLDSNFRRAAEIMEVYSEDKYVPEYVRGIWKRYRNFTLDINLKITTLANNLTGNNSVISKEHALKIKRILSPYKEPELIERALLDLQGSNVKKQRKALKSLYIQKDFY